MDREDPGRGGGLRERKKRETRTALSWAAIRLTVERGLANVRIEDIAAEAGVSPRTFNNYFSGKAEAIAARHVERAHRIAEELRARPGSEPLWDAVVHAALARFALDQQGEADRAPDERWTAGVRLMVGEPALQGEFFKANALAEAELAAAVAERTGTDAARDLYPRLVAAAVCGAVAVVMERFLVGGEDGGEGGGAGPGGGAGAGSGTGAGSGARAKSGESGEARSFPSLLRDALGQLAEGLPPPAPTRGSAHGERKRPEDPGETGSRETESR
ncbi:TetR family transcriptional regulator [Streptomyces sp. HNM0575]|uniref:TetR/AcrR family transcriptional regulator n=1 Tax=Streptomyces sp. HNM0575 TaxID=2716338 RepID=UPI00145C7BDF|nr:TetR/AcrR family transcriptional regulator [Streptomyces sp. HNM0575]NLU76345.1 TetR family transcriptional regulator [Streptomyces sp. HNM0575]